MQNSGSVEGNYVETTARVWEVLISKIRSPGGGMNLSKMYGEKKP
jgi:hypothetical protein